MAWIESQLMAWWPSGMADDPPDAKNHQHVSMLARYCYYIIYSIREILQKFLNLQPWLRNQTLYVPDFSPPLPKSSFVFIVFPLNWF